MPSTSSKTRRAPSAETVLRRVVAHVERRFPEMKGVTPSASRGSDGGQEFTFRTSISLGAGRLSQIVRVIVDPQGRIQRVVTTR